MHTFRVRMFGALYIPFVLLVNMVQKAFVSNVRVDNLGRLRK